MKITWKQVCEARHKVKAAEREITVLSQKTQNNVCITTIVVYDGNRSEWVQFACECFNRNKLCDNDKCPMYNKNHEYVSERQRYKSLRKQFFYNLFHGRQQQ